MNSLCHLCRIHQFVSASRTPDGGPHLVYPHPAGRPTVWATLNMMDAGPNLSNFIIVEFNVKVGIIFPITTEHCHQQL